MTVWSSTYVSLGTVVSGAANSWVVSVGGTYGSQAMQAATIGASVPTAADAVFFDQAGTYTVTCTGALTCLDITVSAGTVTFAQGTSPTFAITGSMSLVAGTVWTATGTITFNATTTGKTVSASGVSFASAIIFNGVGGGWTLSTAITVTNTTGITFANGTFSTGNFACSSPTYTTSTGTKSVSLGSSAITATKTIIAWSFGTVTGLTFNAGTSTITCNASGGPYFSGGGLTYNNVIFSGSGNGSISGANTFANLTVTNSTAENMARVYINANQIITGTLTANAGTYNSRVTFSGGGTSYTITAATVALAYCDFQDITAAGASGTWSGTSFGNCGGNSNITFPAAKTVYWNLAGAQNYSAVGWATTSGGSPAAANFPLPQDTVIFNNTGSVTGTITINEIWNIGTMDMSARTSAMTLATTPAIHFYGSWKNGTGTTLSGSNFIYCFGKTTQQITSAGKTFTQSFNVDNVSGTVQLIDDLTATNGLYLVSGTLDINGKNLNIPDFNSSYSNTRTIAFGIGSVTCSGTGTVWNTATTTGLTVTGAGSISLTSASAKTFAGGGFSYSTITLDQGGAGALTITGSNTFSDITNTYNATGATSILFTAGTTSTFTNWNASGAAGKVLTISSVTAATHTLSKATGTVNADYLSLTNSIATGGATWNATNSTDGGGNTGWIITGATPSSTGNFFFMFD
jgi:hypothetical protein